MGIKEAISEAMSEEPSGDMGDSSIRIEACDSIEKSIVGARVAKEASVTIVTAVCWKTRNPLSVVSLKSCNWRQRMW